MKTETLKQRIADRLTTKKGELKTRYAHINDFLLEGKAHYIKWCNHGRTLNRAKHDATLEALSALGIDYTVGNDAPRGGMEGCFIALTAKGKLQVKDYVTFLKSQTI